MEVHPNCSEVHLSPRGCVMRHPLGANVYHTHLVRVRTHFAQQRSSSYILILQPLGAW